MPSSATRHARLTLREQVQTLAKRVAKLERAHTRMEPASTSRPIAGSTRNDHGRAEIDGRMKASREYYEQKWLDFYRQYPNMLQKDLEEERRHDAFLRARGAAPRESDLERYANLLAQEERAAANRRPCKRPEESSLEETAYRGQSDTADLAD